jgi:hypothetical protein
MQRTQARSQKMSRPITILDVTHWYTRGGEKKSIVRKGHHAEVLPREYIKLFGRGHTISKGEADYSLCFRIGDRCEQDAYNFTYLGTIVAIGEKTVTVKCDLYGKLHRMSIYDFSFHNWDFDLERIEKENDNTAECI